MLREAGIISSNKRGTNIYYKLSLCCLETFCGVQNLSKTCTIPNR